MQWLLVPAAALITGAVVIPVALVSQNAGVTAMPTEQEQAWAEQVCTTRPSARSPAQDDVRAMTIVAAAVCRWENPENLKDDTVGLQSITALTPNQVTALQDFVTDAPSEQPTCTDDRQPTAVEFYALSA